MKKVVSLCLAFALVALFTGISCKLVEDGGESTQGVNALRLAAGDASPWTENTGDGFIQFKASNMFRLINGGAKTHVDMGVVAGFQQNMSIGGSKIASLLVLDFATEANANARYAKYDASNEDKLNAGDYPQSVAQLDNSPMSGVVAIAHFGKYYMELSFTGYTVKTDARTTAASFVEVFAEKISALK